MKQPLFNIGLLGSVSSGKSTCIKALTGKKTQKHSAEKIKNITIKPGYANLKIYTNGETLYTENQLTVMNENLLDYQLINHCSFVDCPGHHELTLTMLGQVNIMDGAIVVISACENVIDNTQLIEHLKAAKLAEIKNIIICLNKIDLVSKDKALLKKKEIETLFNKLKLDYISIIPTSFNYNIVSNLLDIINNIKSEKPDIPIFYISRSFDINKPGTEFANIKGGVVGGSLVSGELKIGDVIEIKPGLVSQNKYEIIKTTIKSLMSENEYLDKVHSGGLIAIGLNIDANYTKNDKLAGNLLGLENQLPEIYNEIKINYYPIENNKLKINDKIYLQIGTLSVLSLIIDIKDNKYKFKLSRPCCIDKNSKIYLCCRENNFNILGYGVIYSI
jgi:translation initiation factor 2 subunit 3